MQVGFSFLELLCVQLFNLGDSVRIIFRLGAAGDRTGNLPVTQPGLAPYRAHAHKRY